MNKALARLVPFVALAMASAVAADSGSMTPRQATGGLAAEVERLARETDERVWLSYAVPMISGDHGMCCFHHDGGERRRECYLDDDGYSVIHDDDLPAGDDRRLRIYLEIRRGELRGVRAYDDACAIRARRGGIHDLRGVDPADSVRYLTSLFGDRREDVAEGSMMAVAFHADAGAGVALIDATRTRNPVAVRRQAAFWLGAARPGEGFDTLRQMVQEDPHPEAREQAVFALSLDDSPRNVGLLVELARKNDKADVRRTALFWLGQKAGERVAETLSEAVFDDPEVEVKEHAVFALSQLPGDEGVGRLIDVATTHDHPEIRRAALFWLGQSGDPRALDLFEKLLE